MIYIERKTLLFICVIIKLKKSISKNFWLNINDPNMDIPGLVEYSNLMPMKENVIYVPFYLLICCNIGFDAPGKTYLKFKKKCEAESNTKSYYY